MKKKICAIFVVLVLILTIMSTLSFATEVEGNEAIALTTSEEITESEENEELTNEEILYDDLFVIEDEEYTMNQNVEGNVFIICSKNVNITGKVDGDIYVLTPEKLTIGEEAYAINVFALASRGIEVNGYVYDIYSLTPRFEMTEKGYIQRNLYTLADEAILRGIVYFNANVKADKIDVGNEEDGLLVGGDFNYSSLNEIEGLDKIVNGEIRFNKSDIVEEVTTEKQVLQYVESAAMSLVYVLLVYGLLAVLSPKFVERVGKDLKEKAIVDLGVGLLTWVLIAFAIIMSLMLIVQTEIGLPVMLAVLAITSIMIYISSAVLSVAITELIKNKNEKIQASKPLYILILLAIGLCVWGIQKIPQIGFIISIIVLTMGLGLIIRNIVSRNNNQEESVKVEENN